MTVQQFQNIGKIQAEDVVDHIGYAICELFKLTPKQVDNLPRVVQLLLAGRVAKQLSNVRKPKWFAPDFIEHAEQITFGQFVEVNEWMKRGADDCLHMIAASILVERGNHKEDAAKMQRLNIRKVLPYVERFLESYVDLTLQYGGLFESNVSEEDNEPVHPFMDNFGWMYTVKEVANYLGLTINEVYKINIIEALNVMAYLKSYNDYIEWQQKQI